MSIRGWQTMPLVTFLWFNYWNEGKILCSNWRLIPNLGSGIVIEEKDFTNICIQGKLHKQHLQSNSQRSVTTTCNMIWTEETTVFSIMKMACNSCELCFKTSNFSFIIRVCLCTAVKRSHQKMGKYSLAKKVNYVKFVRTSPNYKEIWNKTNAF